MEAILQSRHNIVRKIPVWMTCQCRLPTKHIEGSSHLRQPNIHSTSMWLRKTTSIESKQMVAVNIRAYKNIICKPQNPVKSYQPNTSCNLVATTKQYEAASMPFPMDATLIQSKYHNEISSTCTAFSYTIATINHRTSLT